MNSLHQMLPRIPYEIINHIISFCEDDLVCHYYHLTRGTFIHRINWKSDCIVEIKSTLLMHRFFPYYVILCEDSDYRFIYHFLKEYFMENLSIIT